MQGGCQRIMFVFYGLEAGTKVGLCSFYRIPSSCFLSRAGGGDVISRGGNLGLHHNAVKRRGTQQSSAGETEVAQGPPGADRVPGAAIVARFKDVAGDAAYYQH